MRLAGLAEVLLWSYTDPGNYKKQVGWLPWVKGKSYGIRHLKKKESKKYKCFLTLAVPFEGGWYLDQKLFLLELLFQAWPSQEWWKAVAIRGLSVACVEWVTALQVFPNGPLQCGAAPTRAGRRWQAGCVSPGWALLLTVGSVLCGPCTRHPCMGTSHCSHGCCLMVCPVRALRLLFWVIQPLH